MEQHMTELTPTTDIEDTTNIFTLATTFTDEAGNPIWLKL